MQSLSAHLIGGYQRALRAQLIDLSDGEELPAKAYHLFEKLFDTINTATNMMQLQVANAQQGHIDKESFVGCSMLEVIIKAIDHYPFSTETRALVHWDGLHAFQFQGDALLAQHVLWNLMKNALHAIHQAGKGEVFIRFEQDERFNKVLFRDTALGISAEDIGKIFDPHYTTGGSGLGLAFCKAVMQAFEGDIQCEAQAGEYTRFILSFPTLER